MLPFIVIKSFQPSSCLLFPSKHISDMCIAGAETMTAHIKHHQDPLPADAKLADHSLGVYVRPHQTEAHAEL